MNRIFSTLAVISNLGLWATFLLGWIVITPGLEGSTGLPLTVHFLSALAALTLALLVHAVVLTYFMGTGRWIEETSQAYQLGIDSREQNIRLKYQTLSGMVVCFVLLIVTGGFGAATDPGAGLNMPSAKTIHMLLACSSLVVNVIVNFLEYETIRRNGRLIEEIMTSVRTIRRERGLDQPVAAE